VVLDELDKEIVEAEFHAHFKHEELLGTRVVFRNGNPILPTELIKVSAQTARSTTIMATDFEADKSDAGVLRVVLSLRSLPNVSR